MVKTLIFALLATMCATFLWGCGGKVSYTTVDGTMLGTTLHVVADVQGTSPQELYAAVMALDREAKASMSIFDPASLLSRLNRNQTDSVDRHIAFNLRLADSISSLSDGRYDVTVKPLVEAWGFAGKEAQENPNVDSILAFVGRQKVRIENGRLIKDDPRVQLDFNSIAKGYTVDLLAQLVESFGADWSRNTRLKTTSSTSAAKSAARASTGRGIRGASASRPRSTATCRTANTSSGVSG